MTEYQELLVDYCRESHCDPEAVQERTSQIEQIKRLRASNPSWFTLSPQSTDCRCWRQYVIEKLEIEDYALERLGQVATFKSLGQFEVNRLQRTYNEALDAMSDWASWDAEEQRKKGLEHIHHGDDWRTGWSW